MIALLALGQMWDTTAYAQQVSVDKQQPSSLTSGNKLGVMDWPEPGQDTTDFQLHYADLSTFWAESSFPVAFRGVPSIQTKDSDAASTGDGTVLSVTVNTATQVCVFHTDDQVTKADWLNNDYTDLSLDATISGETFSIYCDDVAAGTTINFGGNCPVGGCGSSEPNYVVALVPSWRAITNAAADTTPPSQVLNVQVEEGNTLGIVTWSAATDDVAVKEYDVYQGTAGSEGGEVVDATITHPTVTHTLTALTNDTQYFTRVTAKDTSDNAGTTSDSFYFTPSAGDPPPPGGGNPVLARSFNAESLADMECIANEWCTHVQANDSTVYDLDVIATSELCTGCSRYGHARLEFDGRSSSHRRAEWTIQGPYRNYNMDSHGGGEYSADQVL